MDDDQKSLAPAPGTDPIKLANGDEKLLVRVSNLSDANRRLRRKLFDLYTVFEISRHLSSMLDMESLIDAILLTCIGQMGVEGAVIFITDRESKFVERPHSRGLPADLFNKLRIDYASGLVESLITSGKPLDLKELEQNVGEGDDFMELLKGYDIRLAVPMLMKNQLLGILFLQNKISKADFFDNDLEFLSLLMNQLSVALENARLYERERRAKEELYRTQKLLVETEKMAALGKLSASIAHEVNNPLGIISNYLQILSIHKVPDDVHANYITILKEEVFRIAGIVQQMLDFYRPQQERLGEVDIKRVLAESISLLANQLAASKIEIALDVEKSLPKLMGSPGKLKQVFLNLLMNAKDFMPNGGQIEILAGEKDGNVEISISDTGPGIPEEMLIRVFEPFFTTKKKDGTGLGLSVCYGIIQWHGGEITAFNNSQGGATFKVSLPITRENA